MAEKSNENGNGTGQDLTVADAADRLGISESSLRQMLVSAEQDEAQTGEVDPGMSQLPALQGGGNGVEATRGRRRRGPNSQLGPSVLGELMPLYQALLREKEARVEQQARETETLRARVEQLERSLGEALAIAAREQALRALPDPSGEIEPKTARLIAEKDSRITEQSTRISFLEEAQRRTLEALTKSQDSNEAAQNKRPWWRFW